MNKVWDYITRATELTALSVSLLIKEKGFTPQDLLTEEESIKREKLIDQAGVDAMRTALTDIPFVMKVVGSEGRKHIHQYGEALPTLEGVFGTGNSKLDMVNDVVEGSKAAKLNSPGAVSVIAVSSDKGLMGTPSDINYMDKLFGPPQLKGKISISKPVEENLAEVVDTFQVKPSKINVVMMNRDRNAHYINVCQKFGVNLILINAGDFLPSILSCLDPNTHEKGIHLVLGSGGFEEGILAAVAGKALGAVVEGRGWSADKQIQSRYAKVWSINDLVSGKKDDCFVSISAITKENKWFVLKGVDKKNGGHAVTTLSISKDGIRIIRKIHH
ncbi:MAG: fructose-bisphosphatase class II [Candidatus Levybacteria bacterium]|nr:fructose-bisphosphatase class II [Candidatus Levybacteria bacterium]